MPKLRVKNMGFFRGKVQGRGGAGRSSRSYLDINFTRLFRCETHLKLGGKMKNWF